MSTRSAARMSPRASWPMGWATSPGRSLRRSHSPPARVPDRLRTALSVLVCPTWRLNTGSLRRAALGHGGDR